MKRSVLILGCTGSIGTQTVDVLHLHNDRFETLGLCCGNDAETLYRQANALKPRFVAARVPLDANRLPEGTAIFTGEDAAERIATEANADITVLAISAYAALKPLLAAIRHGGRIAIANKESLVCGGALVDAALKASGAELVPIDSEQSAIFQCLQNGRRDEVRRLILTASGGPFFRKSREELKTVSLADALNHPTWKMGGKITIDCATMMNKGLEVIEAMHLFGMGPDRIDVAVHPQSIVHSMVEFTDGSVMAQLGVPDMKTPIELALTYPYRGSTARPGLDITGLGSLTFEKPRTDVFRCLKLAYDAAHAGGTMPAVLNGANEEAVTLFLKGKISFAGISELVEGAMSAHASARLSCKELDKAPGLDAVLAADRGARDYVRRSMNCP